jgi:predicted small secreted protein
MISIKRNKHLFFIVLIFAFLVSGCETGKCIRDGKYPIEGAKKDAHGFWQGMSKANDWIKKNLWW